jgi:hypothetical protein
MVFMYNSSNVSPRHVFQTLHVNDPPKFTADDRDTHNFGTKSFRRQAFGTRSGEISFTSLLT